MKFRGVNFEKGMYVAVARKVNEVCYTDSKVSTICIHTGVIRRIDSEYICISQFHDNTDTLEIIPWERVLYVIDQHAKTSNPLVNRIRKITANVRNKRMFKNVGKALYALTKY